MMIAARRGAATLTISVTTFIVLLILQAEKIVIADCGEEAANRP
jgi:hypothetical protein